MLAALIVGVGCARAGPAAHFCGEWASLTNEARRARVVSFADDYLTTEPSRALADSLRACVRERADGFLKDRDRYYVCDSGDDFTAGKILGQAQGTSVAICLQQLRTGNVGR